MRKKILLVKDIMVKGLKTIPADATVREAAEILHRGEFSGAPVVDAKGNLVGVVSEKDLFGTLFPTYQEFYAQEAILPCCEPEGMETWLRESGNKKISEVVKKPITTTPDAPLVQIGATMMARGIHRLPVVQKGKLVGMISRRRLYRAIFKHLFGFKK
ncbi:MAG: CBS domain-containing protein [Patescibacteria group bacterium]|nr:CBS domain-containing protein [Patescibacteria group bacterium]